MSCILHGFLLHNLDYHSLPSPMHMAHFFIYIFLNVSQFFTYTFLSSSLLCIWLICIVGLIYVLHLTFLGL